MAHGQASDLHLPQVPSVLIQSNLYLKRISCVENREANMVAAVGSGDAAYSRMISPGHVGHFQTLSSSRQFHNNNAAFRSFPTSAMIGISNNALMPESNPLQDTQEKSEFPFSMMDNGSCSDIWSSAMQPSRTSFYSSSENVLDRLRYIT
ncbi:unnamed protein product [Lupinus luteus]|uniref:Uncharacterized protein n=1 Tax=Lupinus luteus TaxID=3873 RepID=A0AAV1XN64_LUPLU